MFIETLLSDPSRRATEFPVTSERAFLAHAGVAPLPRRAGAAIRAYLDQAERDDQEDVLPPQLIAETRARAAALLGCVADEIALIGPTSLGLSLVANGIEFPPGSNVVFHAEDYPANVYPWRNLAERGVELRALRPERLGEVTPELVAGQVDVRTRLVALSSAHYLSGFRLDLDAIGRLAHERGALFCVDGIQTLGALKTSVAHVDFLAADGHKWLLAPDAAGIFFVRRAAFGAMQPLLLGAGNVHSPGYIVQERLTHPETAARYEPGSMNLMGIVGLHASLGLLAEAGAEAIEERVLRLASQLIAGLQAKGYQILGPVAGPSLSGIISGQKPGVDLREVHAALAAQRISASLRVTRRGALALRFSPHFYNTEAEIERALSAL